MLNESVIFVYVPKRCRYSLFMERYCLERQQIITEHDKILKCIVQPYCSTVKSVFILFCFLIKRDRLHLFPTSVWELRSPGGVRKKRFINPQIYFRNTVIMLHFLPPGE